MFIRRSAPRDQPRMQKSYQSQTNIGLPTFDNRLGPDTLTPKMARPLSVEARQKAIAAAQEVIAADGIEGFTIEAVAKRSGVAKTTIYRHFESGNELLIHAVHSMVQSIPTPDTGSLAGDIEALFNCIGPIFDDEIMRRTIIGIVSASIFDPDLHCAHQDLMNERATPIVSILQAAIERGELNETLDMSLAIDAVEGPFFFRCLVRREPLGPPETHALAQLIANGLKSS